MNTTLFAKVVAAVSLVAFALSGCSSMSATSEAKSAASLYQQLGGSESMTKLASGMLNSSAKDQRLSTLLSHVDIPAATQKVSDQMCSALGGGCKAPYSNSQLSTAAYNLSSYQTMAVADHFDSALKALTSDPTLRNAVNKSIGSKLGGIVGAVL
jgi:truncated hemoglobin YjbI